VRKRRIVWQLYFSYLLVTLLALVTVALFASRSIGRLVLEQTSEDLAARAELIRHEVQAAFRVDDPSALDPLCKEIGRASGTRITVILTDGTVIADSDESPQLMEPHGGPGRPEITQALDGDQGQSTRYSRTLQRSMVYVALPIHDPQSGEILGVLRTSVPLTSVRDALRAIRTEIAMGALGVAVLFAALSLVISRRITHPLEELQRGAAAFARGELGRRLPDFSPAEVGTVARAMNRMAEDLNARIQALTHQRNEQEAILYSMVEGVLAVDMDQKIVTMNNAAGRILRVDPTLAQGQGIQEMVRIPDLQRMVIQVLSQPETVEGQVTLHNGQERYLQIHGAPLRDARGTHAGAVLVMNDVTRLQRLERIRRDFVSNVSHELKTPITSIKASVETLEGGAIDEGPDAHRFLGMISRHADRLGAIIEDLLHLSRIEEDTESAEIPLERHEVAPVLHKAVQTCAARAEGREIRVRIECPDDLTAMINPTLLENAVVNLIDNAIKYCEEGASIEVGARSDGGEVAISVADEGPGIAPEHLPRIFERFYRIDKGRSRTLGGTGLGLAIVKHIAQAHGGRVDVQSQRGRGSTFTVFVPRA